MEVGVTGRLAWLINGFVTRVTRRVPHVDQELLPLPHHPGSPPVFSEVHVARLLVFCIVFCGSMFVLFLLAIVLSVLPFTISDYLFGIFKLFFKIAVILDWGRGCWTHFWKLIQITEQSHKSPLWRLSWFYGKLLF